MISFFTTYKNFEGLLKVTQTNSIRSWKCLHPDIEIILFDSNPVAEKLAGELGLVYVPEVKKNEKGTPYLSEMFHHAQKMARHPLCCYINCDIVLGPDFMKAAKTVHSKFHKNFLMMGARQDLDWERLLDFTDPDGMDEFYRTAREKGERHGVSGIDYFFFSKGFYKNIPPFLAGRAGFDNWLIWRARQQGHVIDGTEAVFAIHQNHDFTHLKDESVSRELLSKTKVKDKISVEGEEGRYNLQFLGKSKNAGFNILDARWKFSGDEIVKKNSEEEINRYLGRLAQLYPRWRFFLDIYKRLYRRFLLA